MNDNTFPPLFVIDVDETKSLSCRTCGTEFVGDRRAYEEHAIEQQHIIEIAVTSTTFLVPQLRVHV